MGITIQETRIEPQSKSINLNKVQGIDWIEVELFKYLSDCSGVMNDMCIHILSAGGKRIRPLLVLQSGLIFNGQMNTLLKAASAAELIHMASLVHDDIIDNSPVRRNKPSINKVWGKHYSVLCGDYLFSRAFGILSEYRLIKSMDFMVEAIRNMCQGEIVQAEERYNHEISREKYYDIIGMKTAIFLSCCCKSGAASAGADELHVEMLGKYGLNIGYAFQIIDDILDICGNIEETGKPKCEDLYQGNITLPVIMLLNDEIYGEWMAETIKNRSFSEKTVESVILLLKNTGIIDKCFKIAHFHIMEAKKSLKLIPKSQYTAFLEQLADMLLARKN